MLLFQGFDSQKELGRDASTWLQVYVGLAWTLGCGTVGLLIVREPAECKIGRQYLCQVRAFPFDCLRQAEKLERFLIRCFFFRQQDC